MFVEVSRYRCLLSGSNASSKFLPSMAQYNSLLRSNPPSFPYPLIFSTYFAHTNEYEMKTTTAGLTPAQAKIIENHNLLSQWEITLVSSLGPPSPNIEEFYHTITLPSSSAPPQGGNISNKQPNSNSFTANLKIFRCKSTPAAQRPLIVLFHGGGFDAGSIEMCTRPAREFAEEFGAVVVSASYRLAPEFPFPQGVEDGLEVLRWLDEDAFAAAEGGVGGGVVGGVAGANPGVGFVMGGFSAGATIAAVAPSLLHGGCGGDDAVLEALARPAPRHRVTGIFLAVPMLLSKEIVPEQYRKLWTSRGDGSTDPAITGKSVDENSLAIGLDPHSPYFSALNSAKGLQGLPRTYIQAGGRDVLRDDSVVYHKLLQDAGVDTLLDVHAEEGHSCFSIWWNEETGSPTLKQKSMAGMAWLLRKDLTA